MGTPDDALAGLDATIAALTVRIDDLLAAHLVQLAAWRALAPGSAAYREGAGRVVAMMRDLLALLTERAILGQERAARAAYIP